MAGLDGKFLMAAAIGGVIGTLAAALLLLLWEAVSGRLSSPGNPTPERWALGYA